MIKGPGGYLYLPFALCPTVEIEIPSFRPGDIVLGVFLCLFELRVVLVLLHCSGVLDDGLSMPPIVFTLLFFKPSFFSGSNLLSLFSM